MKLLTSRWTALAVVLAAAGLAAFGHVRRSPRPPPSFQSPELHIALDELGAEIAHVDSAAMRAAFERAGLPDPPALGSFDAVVLRNVLDAAERYSRIRDGDLLGTMGAVFLALEAHAPAAEFLAVAAESGAQRERWCYLLGAACQSLQWNAAALEALEKARALDSRVAITHARIGELLLSSARAREAVASFDAALQRDATLSVAATGKARALLELGELPAALAAAQQAVRAQPRDFAAHRVLADLLARSSKHDQALVSAQTARSLPTYQGWITFDTRLKEEVRRAGVLSFLPAELNSALQAGFLEHALALAQELIKRRPRDPVPHAVLASLFAQTQQLPAARNAIARALELQPENVKYRLAAAEIEIAVGDLGRARAELEQAFAREPHSDAVLAVRGYIRYNTGERDAGLADLRAASRAAPAEMQHREMLLAMLEAEGRLEEVRALLEESANTPEAREWAQAQIARRRAADPQSQR